MADTMGSPWPCILVRCGTTFWRTISPFARSVASVFTSFGKTLFRKRANNNPSVLFPSRDRPRSRKHDEGGKSTTRRDGRRSAGIPHLDARGRRPDRENPAIAGRNRRIHAGSDPGFIFPRLRQENIVFAAPHRHGAAAGKREPTAIHRAGIQFPGPIAELLGLRKGTASDGPRDIKIPATR